MNATLFVLSALVWTGLLYAAARLLAAQAEPHFQQLVWRIAALFMVLPLILQLTLPTLPYGADPTPISDLPLWLENSGDAAPLSLTPETRTSWAPSLNTLLIAGLSLGWMWRLCLWASAQWSLQAIKRRAHDADPKDLLPLQTRLTVKITEGCHSPFIAGWIKPAIYLPAGMTRHDMLRAVIAHEHTHFKRGDLISSPIERFLADLFWFSPFAHMTSTALEQAREEVCDHLTAEELGNRKSYAQALVAVAREFRPGRHPAPSFIPNRKESLAMRIDRIVRPNTAPTLKKRLVAFILGACLLPAAIAQGVSEKSHKVMFEHPLFKTEKARLTSKYGMREHPIEKKQAWHAGIDIGAPLGTKVYAPTSGTVVTAEFRKKYGNLIDISLSDGSLLRFSQLEKIGVAVGDEVSPGDVIATVGSSGRSTGPHLHFELRMKLDAPKPKPVNPLEVSNLQIK
ncbi:MAG: M23/M56 family metallopeptidase [Pseudomonadota bacterium]